MKKKDVLELKKRLTKNDCTFSPTIAAVIDEKAVKASHKRDSIEHMKKMLKGAAEEIKILNGGKETELTEKIREVTGV